MSQVEAAEKVDVRQNTWSDWEHGRKSPQIRQAIAIFRLTGVPVESWAPDTSAKAS